MAQRRPAAFTGPGWHHKAPLERSSFTNTHNGERGGGCYICRLLFSPQKEEKTWPTRPVGSVYKAQLSHAACAVWQTPVHCQTPFSKLLTLYSSRSCLPRYIIFFCPLRLAIILICDVEVGRFCCDKKADMHYHYLSDGCLALVDTGWFSLSRPWTLWIRRQTDLHWAVLHFIWGWSSIRGNKYIGHKVNMPRCFK